jgi:hypothetical protein
MVDELGSESHPFVLPSGAGGRPNLASTGPDNQVTWAPVKASITVSTSAPIPPGAHDHDDRAAGPGRPRIGDRELLILSLDGHVMGAPGEANLDRRHGRPRRGHLHVSQLRPVVHPLEGRPTPYNANSVMSALERYSLN